jgi:uncharacterized protein YdaU (DUF1376 family)
MPLYIGDYLAGTSRLTTELHGAYLLLIMDYWMNGPLPDNDQVLASIAKMTPDAWSNARAMLEQFFSIDQGCWKHGRIEQELNAAQEKKRAAKEKAEKAAAARWGNAPKKGKGESEDAASNATSNPQEQHEECPSPSPSPSQVEPNGSKRASAKKPPPKFSDDDLKTAEYFHASILKVQPDYKKPNLEKWADTVRLMREQDSRTLSDICAVWAFARKDTFWQANILSPTKLREKFDQLKAKMRAPHAINQSPRKESLAERSWRESEEVLADIERFEAGGGAVAEDAEPVWPQVGQSGGSR